MNTFLLAALLVCASLAVCEAAKCSSQADCSASECCVQMTRFLSSTCKKLKQKGDHCLTDVEESREGDKYTFGCPCAPGLKCKPEKTTDHNGIVTFLNDRCVEE